jgi:hypothetical protein
MPHEIWSLVVLLALLKESSRQRPALSHGERPWEGGQAMVLAKDASPKCRKQNAKWLHHMFSARQIMG